MENGGRPEWQEARATMRHLTRKLENLKDLRIEGEIDRVEYQQRKQEIEAAMREAQKRLQNAPTDVRDIEDLLPQIDRIAEIIRTGSPERKKELFNTLFERIEERDGQITAIYPHTWARPFFNSHT